LLVGSILPNEEPIDAAIRDLLEETGITLTLDDFTLLRYNPVRVSLPEGKSQLVYVFSVYVPVPFVTTNLRTLDKLEQAFSAHSTVNPDGTYVFLESIDIDGLSLTPTKTGLLPSRVRKFELLHFGYVTQWETFRRAMTTNQLLCHEDTSLSRHLLFYSRFSTVESCHVWMLSKGYMNHLCGEAPTDLRMGVPPPTTKVAGLAAPLTETQRKSAINSPYQ
jgi:ADP-ribose pyrophosphatase YjhB (NUDIX family)